MGARQIAIDATIAYTAMKQYRKGVNYLMQEAIRVLVADDSDEIRELLEYWFRKSGLRCETARDGVAAENLMSIYKYDLVVTDLAMPASSTPPIFWRRISMTREDISWPARGPS